MSKSNLEIKSPEKLTEFFIKNNIKPYKKHGAFIGFLIKTGIDFENLKLALTELIREEIGAYRKYTNKLEKENRSLKAKLDSLTKESKSDKSVKLDPYELEQVIEYARAFKYFNGGDYKWCPPDKSLDYKVQYYSTKKVTASDETF